MIPQFCFENSFPPLYLVAYTHIYSKEIIIAFFMNYSYVILFTT